MVPGSAPLLPDSAGPDVGATSANGAAPANDPRRASGAGHSAPIAGAPRRGLGRNRVTASASIVAVAGPGGVTRLPVLASQVPLVLRRTPDAVYVVGGAAGPIGGDELSLRISVGPGAFLRVRTAAASIALPGPDGLESVLRITARVEAGGRLEYLPEPVVVSAGARHATIVRVLLADGAALLLRDELLLGRDGEAGGAARSVLRVDYAGRPLLRQALEVSGTDPAFLGPAVLAGHRAVGNLLRVGLAAESGLHSRAVLVAEASPGPLPRPVPASAASPEVAVMPLAGPGVLITALAHDAVTLRRRLDQP